MKKVSKIYLFTHLWQLFRYNKQDAYTGSQNRHGNKPKLLQVDMNSISCDSWTQINTCIICKLYILCGKNHPFDGWIWNIIINNVSSELSDMRMKSWFALHGYDLKCDKVKPGLQSNCKPRQWETSQLDVNLWLVLWVSISFLFSLSLARVSSQ